MSGEPLKINSGAGPVVPLFFAFFLVFHFLPGFCDLLLSCFGTFAAAKKFPLAPSSSVRPLFVLLLFLPFSKKSPKYPKYLSGQQHPNPCHTMAAPNTAVAFLLLLLCLLVGNAYSMFLCLSHCLIPHSPTYLSTHVFSGRTVYVVVNTNNTECVMNGGSYTCPSLSDALQIMAAGDVWHSNPYPCTHAHEHAHKVTHTVPSMRGT